MTSQQKHPSRTPPSWGGFLCQRRGGFPGSTCRVPLMHIIDVFHSCISFMYFIHVHHACISFVYIIHVYHSYISFMYIIYLYRTHQERPSLRWSFLTNPYWSLFARPYRSLFARPYRSLFTYLSYIAHIKRDQVSFARLL